jgi:Flp pilus assembly protein TadG
MKRSPGWFTGEDGQALVEFALVTPLLLILILGIVEFGRAWGMSQVITDAARQGVRTAAILNTAPSSVTVDSVKNVTLRALAAGRIFVPSDSVKVLGFKDGPNTAATVSVAVPFDFGAFGPVMRLGSQVFGADNITLRSTAVMRNE